MWEPVEGIVVDTERIEREVQIGRGRETDAHVGVMTAVAMWLEERGFDATFRQPIVCRGRIRISPDVYGRSFKRVSNTVVEAKVSFTDYRASIDKYHGIIRGPASSKHSSLAEHHWLAASPNIIDRVEVPKKWGLMVVDGRKVTVLEVPEKVRCIMTSNERQTNRCLTWREEDILSRSRRGPGTTPRW